LGNFRKDRLPNHMIDTIDFADAFDFVEDIINRDEKEQIAKKILFGISKENLKFMNLRYLSTYPKPLTFRKCASILKKSLDSLVRKDKNLKAFLKEQYHKYKH